MPVWNFPSLPSHILPPATFCPLSESSSPLYPFPVPGVLSPNVARGFGGALSVTQQARTQPADKPFLVHSELKVTLPRDRDSVIAEVFRESERHSEERLEFYV